LNVVTTWNRAGAGSNFLRFPAAQGNGRPRRRPPVCFVGAELAFELPTAAPRRHRSMPGRRAMRGPPDDAWAVGGCFRPGDRFGNPARLSPAEDDRIDARAVATTSRTRSSLAGFSDRTTYGERSTRVAAELICRHG